MPVQKQSLVVMLTTMIRPTTEWTRPRKEHLWNVWVQSGTLLSSFSFPRMPNRIYRSIALLGVLGATGAYTSLRAIGKRAHTLHSMTYFSAMSVVVAAVGCASFYLPQTTIEVLKMFYSRMIATHEPVIIPMRLSWLAMLVMIGIFGFFAQVRVQRDV